MTSVDSFNGETPLFSHVCACCGDPIAARHEAICEAILAIDALDHGSDVNGEFTTIYCPSCLVDVFELDKVAICNDIGAMLDF